MTNIKKRGMTKEIWFPLRDRPSAWVVRFRPFPPWLDFLFIAAAMNLGLIQKIFLIYIFDIF